MKFIDLSSGLRTHISNEEDSLIRKIRETNNIALKKEMTEREAQCASELCKRGVLTRTKVKGKIHYVADDSHDIWRI